jgi:hypothetical protein
VRVVRVYQYSIQQQFYALDDIPESLHLEERD